MKTKRSIYNLMFGFGSQLLIIALGIVIPRLVLLSFGSEVNGLMSSIGQVMIYLALLEAGVGTASIQALYKPFSENDKNEINSILAATSIYYKKTGSYYFLAIVVLSLMYPFLLNTSLDYLTVVIIVFLSGIGGVITFFFQGKYKLLLAAEGKGYVNTAVGTIISVLTSIVKISLLLLNFGIITILVSYSILTLFQMLIYEVYIRKNYKWLNLKVKPNFEAIGQKNSVLVHEISSLIFLNTDVLILTLFCNLKIVSVYVMYNMLFTILDSIIFNITSSVTSAFGQSYNENKEKYIQFFNSYETYFMAFVFSVFSITYLLISPFIRLYTTGITDINYNDLWLPILFTSIKLLSYARSPAGDAIGIAGHFKDTQKSSLIESSINIICSLIFVYFYGIYGVLLGTIVALLYRSIDIIIYANRKILNRDPWITVRRWGLNSFIFLSIALISNVFRINPKSYLEIILWAFTLCGVIVPLYFLLNSVMEKEVYQYTKKFIKLYWGREKKNQFV
ncbi:MAG: sugar isomerase [Bacillus sp. (in: firmicutes)]